MILHTDAFVTSNNQALSNSLYLPHVMNIFTKCFKGMKVYNSLDADHSDIRHLKEEELPENACIFLYKYKMN